MRIVQRDGKVERRILIGFLTDKKLLQNLSPKWDNNLFKNRWSNLLAGWCVDYFTKYGEPPNNKIEQIFQSWQEQNNDKESSVYIEKFLSVLSDEYENYQDESNTDYLVDLSQKFFNESKISRLANQLLGDVDQGNLDDAIEKINKFSKLEIGLGCGVDILQDQQAISRVFENTNQESLITFPGDLGDFFNVRDCLHRDCLVSFLGPKGRGKTWMLLAFAWQALLQRRRVAFFEVGDMSQDQIMRRFLIRAAKHPAKACTVKYPTEIKKIGTDEFDVTFKDKIFECDLDYKKAWEACNETMKRKVKSKESYLKLFCYPNDSISVLGIKQQIQSLARQDWIVDVVVIDYADLLSSVDKREVGRDQINTTWKCLRSLSQEYHCLVLTATQANAKSYNVRLVTRSNFADDRRKIDHVNIMLGLNATEEMKRDGIIGINFVAARESEFSEFKQIYVAGCLSLANPLIKSTY